MKKLLRFSAVLLIAVGFLGLFVCSVVLVYQYSGLLFSLLMLSVEIILTGVVLGCIGYNDEKEKERESERKSEQYEMRVTHTSYYLDD